MCKISVVTSVFNAEKYIGETIQSVIDQTYEDWEYIIIDDCSEDRSGEIIKKFCNQDSRIKYIRNEINKGQSENLNNGIRLSKGEYIARLDHDDLCAPERFEKQLVYMEAHPEVLLLGSCMMEWKNGRTRPYTIDTKIKSCAELRFYTLFNSPMAHSSFFIRKSAITDNNIWYGEYYYAEDFAIICDMLSVGEVYRLEEPLITYRFFPEQTTRTVSLNIKNKEAYTIRARYLQDSGFSDKTIIEKSNKGELRTFAEIREFESDIKRYAIYCGVSKKNIEKNPCVKHAYWAALIRQRGGLGMLAAYMTSTLRDRFWLLRRTGLRIFVKSVFRR